MFQVLSESLMMTALVQEKEFLLEENHPAISLKG
jgi:hypothetical protein